MSRAMFSDFNAFTKREVKSIWSITTDLRAGKKVNVQTFDRVCALLERAPDLKYDELRALAVFHGILEV